MSELTVTVRCSTERAVEKMELLARLAREGGRRGLADGADDLVAETKVALLRLSHLPDTPTPSPPGTPPAAISGELARSVRRSRVIALELGRFRTSVGAHTVYARIQQLGGTIHPRHLTKTGAPGWLGWGGTPGHRVHFARSVTLPPRPYLPTAVHAAEVVRRSVLRAIRLAWRI